MTPAVVDAITQCATVFVPALLAFFAGHYHVVLPNPLTPKTVPAPVPVTPSQPNPTPVISPIGQGGLLQLLSLVLTNIAAHPTASVADKATAAAQLVTLAAPFLAPTAVTKV